MRISFLNSSLSGFGLAVAMICVPFALFPSTARAVLITGRTIVQDNFTANDGVTGSDLNGRTPDTANLPGDTWDVLASWGGGIRTTHMGFETGMIETDNSARIGLASAGSYTKPTDMEIYAKFKTIATGTNSVSRGALIGFSNVGAGSGANSLWGIAVRGSDGLLSLVEASASAGQQFSYAGTWDNSVFHEMHYRIDSVTGAISNFMFDGTPYAFSSSAFTDAATNFGVFTASSEHGGTYPTYMDTFRISELVTPPPAPEPTSGLLVFGIIGLVLQRRRWKCGNAAAKFSR
jgi:hypothetical protein